MTGRVAMVTGGAQGIGFGIAVELARARARVIVADIDLTRATEAAERLRSQGYEAAALALDVTNDASVRDGVGRAIEQFGLISVLVNNAGIHCEKIGAVSTLEDFGRCFDVNLFGVWRVSQALVPHFRAQQRGSIVNIASINGRKPWADTPAYSASKAAVINLTQALAMKLGADNINVNAVCPGGVMTAMADQFKGDLPSLEQDVINSRPLKRALLPEDIGRAVVFLASEHARNITGQSLNVDGGAFMN